MPTAETQCPYCKGDQVEGDDITIEGGEAHQVVGCLKCGAEWQTVYRYEDWIPLKAPEGDSDE